MSVERIRLTVDNSELILAFGKLGVSMQLAATAMRDFNAEIVRLADGRCFTRQELEEAAGKTEIPFRRIRL